MTSQSNAGVFRIQGFEPIHKNKPKEWHFELVHKYEPKYWHSAQIFFFLFIYFFLSRLSKQLLKYNVCHQ